VEQRGETVGYGWIDLVWGDAEILIATAPERKGQGVGTFIVERLVEEAEHQGVTRVCNVVRPDHPEAAKLTGWLTARGFREGADGRLERRVRRRKVAHG
jgi:GNAT superfamily N-acetyltransferase